MKKVFDINSVKEEIKANGNVVVNYDTFKRSELFKAIKRKQMANDAVVFLYSQAEHYQISELILEKIGFDFKEGIISGLFKEVRQKCEWDDCFSGLTGFFDSVEDFLQFMLDTYGIKFDGNDEVKDREAIMVLLAALLNDNGAYTFIKGKNAKNPIQDRDTYAKMVPYIHKLKQMVSQDSDTRIVYDIICQAWAMNFPDISSIIERGTSENEKAKLYINLATRTIRRRDYDFLQDNNELVFGVIATIKNRLGDSFPYPANYGSDYTTRSQTNDFVEEFLLFCAGSKTRMKPLELKQREYLYNEILKPLLTKEECKASAHKIFDGYSEENFITAIFNLCPAEELDSYFDEMSKGRSLRMAVKGLFNLYYDKNTERYAKPTVSILDRMIKGCYDWDRLMIPEDKMYDLQFIEDVCNRVKSSGSQTYGVLFGQGWSGNNYTMLTIDLDKMPKEFFEKYETSIDWGCLSRCKNISLEFLKEHRENIAFDNLNSKVCEKIDEELAEWIYERYGRGHNMYVTEAVKKSKALGLEFMVKYMDRLTSRLNNGRKVAFKTKEVKLSDMVALL